MSWLDGLDSVVTFVIYQDRKQVAKNLYDLHSSKTSDLTLWNYEADMKSNENETSVKIRPKLKKNIYMDVSYLSEIRSLTNITEKASLRDIITPISCCIFSLSFQMANNLINLLSSALQRDQRTD